MSKKANIYHSNTYDIDGVYDFICQYKKDNDGNSPSIREIQEAFTVSSTNIVSIILRKLEAQGKIKASRNGLSRGIIVIGGIWNVDQSLLPTSKKEENKTENKKVNYYICDKCVRRLEQRMIVGAYKIAEKRKVKVCRDCAESPEYILTFLSKRKLGYTVRMDSRR